MPEGYLRGCCVRGLGIEDIADLEQHGICSEARIEQSAQHASSQGNTTSKVKDYHLANIALVAPHQINPFPISSAHPSTPTQPIPPFSFSKPTPPSLPPTPTPLPFPFPPNKTTLSHPIPLNNLTLLPGHPALRFAQLALPRQELLPLLVDLALDFDLDLAQLLLLAAELLFLQAHGLGREVFGVHGRVAWGGGCQWGKGLNEWGRGEGGGEDIHRSTTFDALGEFLSTVIFV